MAHESNPLTTEETEYESVHAYGSVTTPAANTALATIAAGSLPAGVYRVEVQCIFSAGAPVAAEDGNFTVRKQTTVLKRLVTSRAISAQFSAQFHATLDGAQSLNVINTTLGTTGVIYSVSLSATRIR